MQHTCVLPLLALACVWDSTRVHVVLLIRGMYSWGVAVSHRLAPWHRCSLCVSGALYPDLSSNQENNESGNHSEAHSWVGVGVQGGSLPSRRSIHKSTNSSWYSAPCQSDTDLLSLKDLIHPCLQVGPYLWFLIQLSDCATYLFCNRNEKSIHLGPGIRLEFEGHVLYVELKGQPKYMDLNVQGI